MKPKHVQAERFNARQTLIACGVALGVDFHTLRTAQVEALLAEADRVRYQKPRDANGSRRVVHALWIARIFDAPADEYGEFVPNAATRFLAMSYVVAGNMLYATVLCDSASGQSQYNFYSSYSGTTWTLTTVGSSDVLTLRTTFAP